MQVTLRARRRAWGLTVIAIKPKAGWPVWRKPGTRRFPLILFSQELLALLEAGLSLMESLETLTQKEQQPEIETQQLVDEGMLLLDRLAVERGEDVSRPHARLVCRTAAHDLGDCDPLGDALLRGHFGLLVQHATQQLNNTAELRKTRRAVARVKTIMAEKARKG